MDKPYLLEYMVYEMLSGEYFPNFNSLQTKPMALEAFRHEEWCYGNVGSKEDQTISYYRHEGHFGGKRFFPWESH